MADPLEKLIIGFDQALRTLTGQSGSGRASPAQSTPEGEMNEQQRRHAAGLMRVNHAGEICAQALYEGQALAAKSQQARETLLQAAAEEQDHLRWCRERLEQLDSTPSVLDPLFYGVSFVMGAFAGLAGDKVSLGFVEATEDQVIAHLDRHLQDLPEEDRRSRLIIKQMREDEQKHAAHALAMGGEEFPRPIKAAMTVVSQLMTKTTYRV